MRIPGSSELLHYLAVILILLVAIAALSVYVIDVTTGHSLDEITKSLLTFLLAFISTIISVRVGGNQAAASTQQAADVFKGNGVQH